MKATNDKLAKLPKEPSKNPQLEISELLSAFVDEVKLQTTGVPKADGIMQLIRPVQDAFRREIRATAPEFRPFSRKQAHVHSLPRPTFLRNEDGDDEGESSDDASVASDDFSGEEVVAIEPNAIYVDEVLSRARQYVVCSFVYAMLYLKYGIVPVRVSSLGITHFSSRHPSSTRASRSGMPRPRRYVARSTPS